MNVISLYLCIINTSKILTRIKNPLIKKYLYIEKGSNGSDFMIHVV